MSIKPIVLPPTSPNLVDLLGVFVALVFCSEGEVYDGVISKQSD